MLELKRHHQHDGRSARRVRRRGDARRARGRHRGRARRPGARCAGVSGVWRELTENVNSMANNLTSQVRNIAEVITAIAAGRPAPQDHGRRARARSSTLKNTINATVDKLNRFAAEVTRVARLVGTEGTLGVQADVQGRLRHLEGADRQRQPDGAQPDRSGARHRRRHHRGRQRRPVARRSPSRSRASSSQLKNTINAMVDSLASFADEVTRMAREVGTEGVLGGQAVVRDVSGDLAGAHRRT